MQIDSFDMLYVINKIHLKLYTVISSLKIHPILPMTYLNLFHLVADSDPSKLGPNALVLAFSP